MKMAANLWMKERRQVEVCRS